MSENKTTERPDHLNGLTSNDTASIFCFSVELEMLKAFSVVEKSEPRLWTQKRKAKPGTMYPYWLISRSDEFNKVAALLKEEGIQWEDVESHYYEAVKDQSQLYSVAQDFAGTTNDQTEPNKPKSAEKKWWRFWK